jgi:sugar-specific transcriptional regulator TrmB
MVGVMGISVYEQLYNSSYLTATDLAKQLGCSRSNIYPVLKKLETRGFVTSLKTKLMPTMFFSVRIEHALDQLVIYQRLAMLDIIRQQRLDDEV